jgi:RsiW-degrading membrane proteinase PrsW (M82 family)
MIIGALGFTLVENFYYIIDSLQNFEYLDSLIRSSYRFLGASLLHVITSAIIGICISVVFFKNKKIRMTMAFIGLMIATGIHTLFNVLVLSGNEFYENMAFYGS